MEISRLSLSTLEEMAEMEDQFIGMSVHLHVSEVDRLSGKVFRFMLEEMPLQIANGQAIEVLENAIWWLRTMSYNDFADRALDDPELLERTYWHELAEIHSKEAG